MYQPEMFQEDRAEVLHDLMRSHPFATLVSFDGKGVVADHIPMVLHPELGDHGVLRGHVARPNPLWQEFDASVDVLAIFQGVHHYITPNWYPSKQETEKVVPTWNYAVVHACGPMTIFKEADWLRAQVESLTMQMESGRSEPWAVSDAPDDYLERQFRGIVGLEIAITQLIGKWKLNQNRTAEDRQGVVEGLKGEDNEAAQTMAGMIPE